MHTDSTYTYACGSQVSSPKPSKLQVVNNGSPLLASKLKFVATHRETGPSWPLGGEEEKARREGLDTLWPALVKAVAASRHGVPLAAAAAADDVEGGRHNGFGKGLLLCSNE